MLFEKYRNRTQAVKRIWSKKYKIKFSATFIVNPKGSHMRWRIPYDCRYN